MDPHTDSADTKDGTETYTYRMAPSSLFPNVTPTKTTGGHVVFGEYVFYLVHQRGNPFGNGLY